MSFDIDSLLPRPVEVTLYTTSTSSNDWENHKRVLKENYKKGEQNMFTQKLTKKDFELVRFPNGEFKIVAQKTINGTIDWKYGDTFANGEKLLSPSEELVALLQLDKLVGKFKFTNVNYQQRETCYREQTITVYADFLPFKRQDKDKLIGEITFNDVYGLISNFKLVEFAPHDKDVFDNRTCDAYQKEAKDVKFVVFPDCGAQHRFYRYDNNVHTKDEDGEIVVSILQKIITFDKVRDAKTGKLEFVDKDLSMVKDKKVVIFDDIIAFGGTFKHVATKLKEAGATHVKLVVNHADTNLNGEVLYNEKEMKESGVDEIVILNGGLGAEVVELTVKPMPTTKGE